MIHLSFFVFRYIFFWLYLLTGRTLWKLSCPSVFHSWPDRVYALDWYFNVCEYELWQNVVICGTCFHGSLVTVAPNGSEILRQVKHNQNSLWNQNTNNISSKDIHFLLSRAYFFSLPKHWRHIIMQTKPIKLAMYRNSSLQTSVVGTVQMERD